MITFSYASERGHPKRCSFSIRVLVPSPIPQTSEVDALIPASWRSGPAGMLVHSQPRSQFLAQRRMGSRGFEFRRRLFGQLVHAMHLAFIQFGLRWLCCAFLSRAARGRCLATTAFDWTRALDSEWGSVESDQLRFGCMGASGWCVDAISTQAGYDNVWMRFPSTTYRLLTETA